MPRLACRETESIVTDRRTPPAGRAAHLPRFRHRGCHVRRSGRPLAPGLWHGDR